MNSHESLEHFGQKQEAWDRQQGLMAKLNRQGAEDFLRSVDKIDDAFEHEKKRVCCMDEGTAHMNIPGKFEMAGSGILYPAASWEERLDKVADIMIGLGITQITSHDGCGAAGLACKRDGIQTDRPDKYGIKWAQDLQNKIMEKTSGKRDVTYRHIQSKEMVRPDEFHLARVAWFDATGRFNPAALGDNIPMGFVIDYKHDTEKATDATEKNYPFEELKVALSIAFGGHGFGEKFNEQNPFVVVVMTEDEQELEQLKERIFQFVADLNIAEETKKAIKVDGYLTQAERELEQAA